MRSVGFKSGPGENPNIFFFMTVHCRFVRAGDEEEVFPRIFIGPVINLLSSLITWTMTRGCCRRRSTARAKKLAPKLQGGFVRIGVNLKEYEYSFLIV